MRWREALDMPDGAIENNLENRLKIVRVLRLLRPRVVILPYWQARHPDHAIVAALGYEACFLSGLSKAPAVRARAVLQTAPSAHLGSDGGDRELAPHRPFKIVYASLYADVRPSFVVDITPFIEVRHAALMAYRSQYANQVAGGALFVPEEEIRGRTFCRGAGITGCWPGFATGNPFVQKEVGLVDDLTLLPVQSI